MKFISFSHIINLLTKYQDMSIKKIYKAAIIALFMTAWPACVMGKDAAATEKEQGGLHMPAIFGDGMVIQRDAEINIWGWARKGEKVTVTLNGRKATAKADKLGAWSVKMKSMEAGGPYTLHIKGKTEEKRIEDVMLGDVFLFSGQSNQELMIYRCLDDKKVAEAVEGYSNDMVRIMKLPHQYNYVKPQDDCIGASWKKVSPETVGNMAAVSCLTAMELQKHAGVAVGIINSSVGGTGVECWMSQENLKRFAEFSKTFSHEKYKNPNWPKERMEKEAKKGGAWDKKLTEQDTVIGRWRTPGYDFSQWREVDIFSQFYDSKQPNGNYWFHNTATLTADDIREIKKENGGRALLRLGALKDADSVFVNGVCVGNTTYQYPPRKYSFDASLLHEGDNDIVIHLISQNRKPFFVKDKKYQLEIPGRNIPLCGKEKPWRMAVGATMEQRPGQTYFVGTPTGLYNAMIHPLGKTAIRGMVWYQGEANEWNPKNYGNLLKAMIEEWQGQFPALEKNGGKPWTSVIVQLAGYQQRHIGAYESGWCRIRTEQRAVTLPEYDMNAVLATAIDCGEYNDIHPQDKETVAHRIALQLLHHTYGEDIVSEGPSPVQCVRNGNSLIITFDRKTGKLRDFNDGIARVCGDYELAIDITAMEKALSTTYSVKDGIFRYAYDDFPLCTIYNKDNIASPQFEINITDKNCIE